MAALVFRIRPVDARLGTWIIRLLVFATSAWLGTACLGPWVAAHRQLVVDDNCQQTRANEPNMARISKQQIANASVLNSDSVTTIRAAELPASKPTLPPTAAFEPDHFPPLPSADQLIDQALPGMIARAEQGDHAAACWLGIELARCAERMQIQASRTHELTWYRRQGDSMPAFESARVALLEREDTEAKRCAGVSPTQWQSSAAWLQQSADAGSLAAMERILGRGLAVSGQFPQRTDLEWTAAREGRFRVAMLRAGSMDSLGGPTAFQRQSLPVIIGLRNPDLLTPELSMAYWQFRESYLAAIQDMPSLQHKAPLPAFPKPDVTLPDARLNRIRAQALALARAAIDSNIEPAAPHVDDVPTDTQCRRFVAPPRPDESIFGMLQ